MFFPCGAPDSVNRVQLGLPCSFAAMLQCLVATARESDEEGEEGRGRVLCPESDPEVWDSGRQGAVPSPRMDGPWGWLVAFIARSGRSQLAALHRGSTGNPSSVCVAQAQSTC